MLRTAWKFLFYDKANSLGALLGIVVSTFLIGQQISVFNFITDGIGKIVTTAPGYIWVLDNKTQNINDLHPLDVRIQYQIASLPGVQKVYPVYITNGYVQYEGGDKESVKLIGVEPPDYAGAPAGFFAGTHQDLLPDGGISVDLYEERVFPITDLGATFEINGKRAYVAAQTKGVRGFARAFSYTTIDRARWFANGSLYEATVFLVKAAPGASPAQVRDAINDNAFGVRAWLEGELRRTSVIFYLKHSSIVLAIGTMVVFAFISGIAIVGLTLYSSAIDHLRDYGTMKAIGATNGYIRKLIYTQALLFGVPGFAIGQLLIRLFRTAMERQGVLVSFTLEFQLAFFGLICLIALLGAAFASRRVIRLEPAAVFRF